MEKQSDEDSSAEVFDDVINTFEEIQDVFNNTPRFSEAHPTERTWLEDFTTSLISWSVDVRMSSKSLMNIKGSAIDRRIQILLRNCKVQVEGAYTDLLKNRYVRHRY